MFSSLSGIPVAPSPAVWRRWLHPARRSIPTCPTPSVHSAENNLRLKPFSGGGGRATCSLCPYWRASLSILMTCWTWNSSCNLSCSPAPWFWPRPPDGVARRRPGRCLVASPRVTGTWRPALIRRPQPARKAPCFTRFCVWQCSIVPKLQIHATGFQRMAWMCPDAYWGISPPTSQTYQISDTDSLARVRTDSPPSWCARAGRRAP